MHRITKALRSRMSTESPTQHRRLVEFSPIKVPISLSPDQLRCNIMDVVEECRCLKRMITVMNQKREFAEQAHMEEIAALQTQIVELRMQVQQIQQLLSLQKSISDAINTDDYEVIPRS